MPPEPKYKPAQSIRKDEQAALQVEADRHAEQLKQVSSLENTTVALANQFLKHVGKTSVVNLSEIDTASIVGAVNNLGSTVDNKYLDLKPIAEGLRDLLQAVADSKKSPAVELHFDKGINPAGSYKGGNSYRAGDAVTFEGAVYVAKQDTKSDPTDKAWLLLLPKGAEGERGPQGPKGDKGDSAVVDYQKIDSHIDNRVMTLPKPKNGKDGKDGYTPVKGLDYFDGKDGVGKQGPKGDKGERGPQGQGWRGIPGVGVPEGGTTGQILAKASNDDHDTEWVTGGSASVSDTAYGASWNGVTGVAPSKNAVYDKIETITAASGIAEELAIAYAVAL